jgi:hypothetical protein
MFLSGSAYGRARFVSVVAVLKPLWSGRSDCAEGAEPLKLSDLFNFKNVFVIEHAFF